MTDTPALPIDLRGDGPCFDCGTVDNIVWFTDNAFWNAVVGGPGATADPGGIFCIPCFVVRADRMGYVPTGWRLTPEWPVRSTRDLTSDAVFAIRRAAQLVNCVDDSELLNDLAAATERGEHW